MDSQLLLTNKYQISIHALPAALQQDTVYYYATPDIAYHAHMAESEYITDMYLHRADKKIDSFATIMFENLSLGFMHYHIPQAEHTFFIDKYPEIAQATNQIHYLYTALPYRQQGLAHNLLDFIIQDMATRGFTYLWLRCEIDPKIYFANGFMPFTRALEENCTHFEMFKQDYEQKVGAWERLNHAFGELRLVKKLSLS